MTAHTYELEICVDSYEGACNAIDGGATRLELCASLSEGGLTPSAGLMQAASTLDIPCFAMIRPRSGLFHFSDDELEIMITDVKTAKAVGLAGVVLGAQGADGGLDLQALGKLIDAAGHMGIALHRVIDVVPDPLLAVDQAIDLGAQRILTSGAATSASAGIDLIKGMVRRADGTISIMPGCGLTSENVADVVHQTGAREVHASCRRRISGEAAFSDFDPPGGRYVTCADEVRRLATALRDAKTDRPAAD